MADVAVETAQVVVVVIHLVYNLAITVHLAAIVAHQTVMATPAAAAAA